MITVICRRLDPAMGQYMGLASSMCLTCGGGVPLLHFLSAVFIVLQPEYGGLMLQLRDNHKAVA